MRLVLVDKQVIQSDWNVVRTDAPLFFVATTLLLYQRAAARYAKQNGRSVWPFVVPAIVGALLFFISTHASQWYSAYSIGGVNELLGDVLEAARNEISSPVAFVRDLADGNPRLAVQNWFQSELVNMGASFFKLSSLYPKVFVVLLVGGIAEYLATADR